MRASEQGVVRITRVFDFSRELVFSMWTDPKKLAEWWGPEGSVTILSEVDPRPGGAMRVDQQNSDGTIYSFRATFEKVTPLELLVFRHSSPGAAGFSPWEALHTIAFEALDPNKTRVTAITVTVGGPQEERESLQKAYVTGWGQSFDKLQKTLS